MRGRNKRESEECRLRVRRLLLREWDPIGIYGVGPEDEYDEYAVKLCAMLMDGEANEAELANFMFRAATEPMGLAAGERLEERSRRVARLLVGVRGEFRTP
jgi:hypothetical protein